MKAIAWFLFAAAGAVATVGSAQAADLKEQIVGKWTPDDAKAKGFDVVFEFTKDGAIKMVINGKGKTFELEGKYKFLDDKTVEVAINPPFSKEEAKSEKMTVKSISGDSMTTVDKDGKEQKFNRVK